MPPLHYILSSGACTGQGQKRQVKESISIQCSENHTLSYTAQHGVSDIRLCRHVFTEDMSRLTDRI